MRSPRVSQALGDVASSEAAVTASASPLTCTIVVTPACSASAARSSWRPLPGGDVTTAPSALASAGANVDGPDGTTTVVVVVLTEA